MNDPSYPSIALAPPVGGCPNSEFKDNRHIWQGSTWMLPQTINNMLIQTCLHCRAVSLWVDPQGMAVSYHVLLPGIYHDDREEPRS